MTKQGSDEYQSIGNDSENWSHKPVIPKIPSEAVPRQGASTQTEVITKWPESSVYVRCLHCNQKGNTKVTRALSKKGKILFCVLCPTVVFAILVLCLNSMYVSKHFCEHCNSCYGTSEN